MEHISQTLKISSLSLKVLRYHLNEIMMLRDDLENCIDKAKDVKEFKTNSVKSIHDHMINHLEILDEGLNKVVNNYER